MKKFLFLLLFSTTILAAEHKTICLNMIVKNEVDVITRCFDSVLPIIDTWVVVDTGSTDGTQKLIKDYFKSKGILGKLYERPWVDFATNRQEALELAVQEADYLLFMDADDKLVLADDFKMPELTKDFYGIASASKGQEFWIPRLIKCGMAWFWEGVVHENLYCHDHTEGLALDGIKYVYIHDGARAKDPTTTLKDIQILERETKNDPTNPRNFFYLARSYLHANQLENALACFQKRSQMKGHEEEVFYSKLTAARIQDALHHDYKIIEKSFLDAYLSRPHRAEPLYFLSLKLYERGDYKKAYSIIRTALELPTKVNDYLEIEKWIYDYGMLLHLATCAEKTGNFHVGIKACEKLLKRTDLPEKAKRDVELRNEALHVKNIARIQKKLSAGL